MSDTFVLNKLATVMEINKDNSFVESSDLLEDCSKNEGIVESTNNATHFMLSLIVNSSCVKWTSATEKHLLSFNMNLAEFILFKFSSIADAVNLHGCTEYVYNTIVMRSSEYAKTMVYQQICVFFHI